MIAQAKARLSAIRAAAAQRAGHGAFVPRGESYGFTGSGALSAPCKALTPLALALLATFALSVTATFLSVTGASAAACPNAAVRDQQHATFLPDCRAYEQVSPESKNGLPLGPTAVHSASGNRVGFLTLGGGLSDVGSGLGEDVRVAERSGPGLWTDHTLLPDPVTWHGLGQLPRTLALSADLSRYIFSTPSLLTPDAPSTPNGLSDLYLGTGSGSYQVLNPLQAMSGALLAANEDLSHIVYESFDAQTNDVVQPFTQYPYAWVNGQVHLVSFLPDGSIPTGNTRLGDAQAHAYHAVSNDGSRIVFTVASPQGGGGQIYLRENLATTVPISASQRTDCAGDPTCGGDSQPDPAPDPAGTLPALFLSAEEEHGSSVLFSSCEKLTDDSTATSVFDPNIEGINCLANFNGNSNDLYRKDVVSGQLADLTTADASGAKVQGVVGASKDLGRIYFVAHGNLAPGAPAGEPLNLYLWDHGTTSYVTSLTEGFNESIGQLPVRGSYNWEMNGSVFHRTAARVSSDGRFALFTSRDPLTSYGAPIQPRCPEIVTGGVGAGEHVPCSQVYFYDAPQHQLSCISCPADGADSFGDSQLFRYTTAGLPGGGGAVEEPLNMLEDGTAFFETPNPLLSADTNGRRDVYEFKDGSLHLISSGTASADANFADATSDGSNVFFTTTERLVASDSGRLVDLYDARAGGGRLEEPTPPPCSNDACQGQVSPAPGEGTPTSATFVGPGDPQARPPCTKAKVRRNGRCVKRKARKHHQKARGAKSNRGGHQ